MTEKIKNGSATFTKNTELGEAPFQTGARIQFKCETNYDMDGDEVITCDSGQKWSGSVPVCAPDGAAVSRGTRDSVAGWLVLCVWRAL